MKLPPHISDNSIVTSFLLNLVSASPKEKGEVTQRRNLCGGECRILYGLCQVEILGVRVENVFRFASFSLTSGLSFPNH